MTLAGRRSFESASLGSHDIHPANIFYQTLQLELHRGWHYLVVIRHTYFRSHTMTTATRNPSFFQAEQAQKAPLTLAAIVAAVFMVDLRESLAAKSSADQSDAVFTCGL